LKYLIFSNQNAPGHMQDDADDVGDTESAEETDDVEETGGEGDDRSL
jgi:hypothetical protein